MDQVLIQLVMDDQGEVSLEYLADLVRRLPPEKIAKLLAHCRNAMTKVQTRRIVLGVSASYGSGLGRHAVSSTGWFPTRGTINFRPMPIDRPYTGLAAPLFGQPFVAPTPAKLSDSVL